MALPLVIVSKGVVHLFIIYPKSILFVYIGRIIKTIGFRPYKHTLATLVAIKGDHNKTIMSLIIPNKQVIILNFTF